MTPPSRRIRRPFIATLLSLGIVVPSLVVGIAGAASADPANEQDFTTLQSDITAAGTTPLTVVLGADITSSGQGLVLPTGGNVTLDLHGHTLTVTGASGQAGIRDVGATLTIKDSSGGGGINATGGNYGPGIFSDDGTVTINGGTVTATGGSYGAGIGGGVSGAGGTVTINAGTVTARGGDDSAGIGGGYGEGGDVTINGGTVTATGGEVGAGIGGGYAGSGSTVMISGGAVTATGGYLGAGVGGGSTGDGGDVTISGGGVTATGGSLAAGIGGGYSGAGGTMVVGAGAVVTATSGGGSNAVVGSNGGSPVGTVSNSGSLTLIGNQTNYGPVTNTASGVIHVDTRMAGSGVVTNQGAILLDGGFVAYSDGGSITTHGFLVGYSTDPAGTAATEVYAPSFSAALANTGAPVLKTPPAGSQWYSAADCTGQVVTASTDLQSVFGPQTASQADVVGGVLTPNITLYAQSMLTLTFDAQGGAPAPAAQTFRSGCATATQPAPPTRAGYTFDGWFTAATGGTKFDFSTSVASSMTLYAHWSITNPVTVSFNAEGGSPTPAAQTIPSGTVAAAPADPALTNYTFKGWFTAATGGTKFNFSTDVAADTTLYAQWSITNPVTVTFNAEGGAPTPAAQTIPSGTSAAAPSAPTLTNYTFDGWYTSASGGTKFDFSTAVPADTTLYAHWSITNPVTVTFNAEGGSPTPAAQTIPSGTSAAAPSAPTLTGYVFEGWFTAATGGTPVDLSTAMFSSDTVLYAQWMNVFTDLNPTVSTPQNQSVTTALSDIASVTGDPLDPTAVTQVVAPAHGSLAINATTGAVTYSPTAGYSGPDSYQVDVCDTSAPPQCHVSTVNVTVGLNVVTANDDTAAASTGSAVTTDVEANDVSASGQALANPTVTTAPSHGTAVVNPDGTITYTPTAGYSGLDSYGYTACDTSTPTPVCSSAAVTVTVDNVFVQGSAVLHGVKTSQNKPVTVPLSSIVSTMGAPLDPTAVTLVSGVAPRLVALTLTTTVSGPSHGSVAIDPTTGAVTYTPKAGYSGSDSFTINVCDTSSPVQCYNESVTVLVGANRLTGRNFTITVANGHATPAIKVLPDVHSISGQPVGRPRISTRPKHGQAKVNSNGSITYTPARGFAGTDSFTYTVCDTGSPQACVTKTITVHVKAAVVSVPSLPDTGGPSLAWLEGAFASLLAGLVLVGRRRRRA